MIRTFYHSLNLHFAVLLLALVIFTNSAPAMAAAVNSPAPDLKKTGSLTIAVVIAQQQADGSSWDIGEGADLVLCGVKGCYVSQGLEKPAIYYENSLGPRVLDKAGACRDSVKCVFRGVDPAKLISAEDPLIFLLDVDYISHTPFEKFKIAALQPCRSDGAVIACEGGVHRQAFSLWAMPEAVAEQGGKAGLDYVLFKGLLSQRSYVLTAALGDIRQAVRADAAAFYKLLFDLSVPPSCLSKPAFLSEVFYVTGLADASQRRAEPLLQDMLGRVELARLEGIVQQSPAVYWAFRDIARQLHLFATATAAEYQKPVEGLYLKVSEKAATEAGPSAVQGASLVYGWEVRSRARTGLSICGVNVSLDKGAKDPAAEVKP
ncbi:MAG: hypothetical protein DHS20C08_21430 [Rhodomicrobium sp.]|nr:MAG: hypothetical protein DHS20C08_21430 [Rhodomicrobium sp.]